MYHFASTGEPPTESPLLSSSQEEDSYIQSSEINQSQQNKRLNSSSLAPHEADSGYEASPSSTNDNCNFSFLSEDIVNHPEETFENSSEQILMMNFGQEEGDIDESDVDEDFAKDSSLESSRRFVGSSSTTQEGESDNDFSRPSSLPIPIPVGGDDSRFRPVSRGNQRLHVRSLPSPDVPEIPSPIGSPCDAIAPVTLRLSLRMPQSWPTRSETNRQPLAIHGIPLRFEFAGLRQSHPRPSLTRSNVQRVRSRGKLIDSEASSVTSSEGDLLEEVFEDSEHPPNVVSSAPNANSNGLFLPDVVPHAHPAGAGGMIVNSNGVRRCRSISINLPLEETIVEIGRSLRRMSDEFNEHIQYRRSRRYTIGEIIRIDIGSLDPNGRRNRDSDDDGDSIFSRRS